MELFLLVNNDGEGTLEVDVTISPVDSTLKDIQIPKIQIPKHQMKKVCFLSFTLAMLYVLPQKWDTLCTGKMLGFLNLD